MEHRIEEKNIRSIFTISLMLKGANAFLEMIGGALLLCTGAVMGSIQVLIQGELIEDPGDFLANSVQHYLPYFSQHSQLFVSFYLLSHGIIKLFLVVGLLRNKVWAYPAAITVFSFFIVYQLYRFTHTHSLFLIALTAFDLMVIWLTWHEYRYHFARITKENISTQKHHE